MEEKNAIIESATLTTEDHGCLSSWIVLDYGGSCQGFGGYSLYLPQGFSHHEKGAGYAGHWIYRVMAIAGVGKWDQLVGKTVRVRAEHDKVHAIGHIVKDDWFCPSDDFKQAEDHNDTT
jgi:hypothetical protein